MFAANTYVIRRAGPADSDALDRIARLDTQRPLTGDALVGELDGVPVAAVSLADGRLIADPFMRTAHLTPLLHMRYRAHRAYIERPSTSDRLRAGVRIRPAMAT
jgi:hypothetical protein